MKFAGAVKILGNAVFENGRISVSNQKEVTILISLATSFVDFKSMPTANALERVMALKVSRVIRSFLMSTLQILPLFSTGLSLILTVEMTICLQIKD